MPSNFSQPRILKTRKFERPSFLSECFDELEPLYYYMYRDCNCTARRNNEIRVAFMSKQRMVVDGLRGVATFIEKMASCKIEAGKALQTTGVHSKSFLASYATSMLFESEKEVFSEVVPHEDSISKIMFYSIRAKYQYIGMQLVEKASEWLQMA